MKICSVVGARPQFIKAGPVSRAIIKAGGIDEIMIHTGQHYDTNLSEVFFREFSLAPPRYNLAVGSARHGAQTARMLEGLEDVLAGESPDVVLVYGDTNSTLAGALAAAKLHFPVAHVEAGLRSFNRRMPEEINRLVADSVSDLLFAPTEAAAAQLRLEGHATDRVVLTGDVMLDASMMVREVARDSAGSLTLRELGLAERGYYVATVHRAENTDSASRLCAIFQALAEVAQVYPVVMPLHPRTKAALVRSDLFETASRSLTIIPPVGFLDMARLLMGARAVVSDSGGLQKEAFFNGVSCFVLRGETEWGELVDAGWNRLVPPGEPSQMARTILEVEALRRSEVRPYGNGDAAEKIVTHVFARYGHERRSSA